MITVISESTKQELMKCLKCRSEKLRVIHASVSPIFRYCPRSFNSLNPVILQVGTGENKNLIRVSKALEGLPCHLQIVGRLSKEQVISLGERGIKYSSIINLSDKEMVQQYRKCDILIFASTYEGFGLPILEAQATGRPVVTSNILSMPEVAGDSACLVNPFSVEDIREGIMRVIQDNNYREDLVRRGLNNIDRFQVRGIAEKYVRVYEELESKIS